MQEMWVGSLGWKDPWRRKWQPTPVFLLGKSHGQRSLAGYMTWSCKVGYNLVTKLLPPFLWTLSDYESTLIPYGTHSSVPNWWPKFTPSMTVNPNHLCGWWSDVLSRLLRNAKSIRSSMFTIWISVFGIQQHAPYVLKHMWLEKEVAAIQFCFIMWIKK